MRVEKKYSVAGRSLVLNALLVFFNLVGLSAVIIGNLPAFVEYFLLLNFLGFIFLAISSGGLFILHGRLMMANFSKVLVGSVLVVSGLIKVNDPVGFSYKLEEYFQDGALAYRLKGIFGASFSMEGLIGAALFLAVLLAVLEVVLGILLIIGGRIKWIMAFLLPMMLFFTFLTWHTSSCAPSAKFTDRNEYPLESTKAKELINAAKSDKSIKIIAKEGGKLVVDEQVSVQCVNDCGCFGDALKGVMGRSLTPLESFMKDLVILYFLLWIVISAKFIQPSNARQVFKFSIYALLILGGFALLFKWPFLVYFSLILIVCSTWVKRDGGYFLGNYIGAAGIVAALSFLIAFYVLRFDSLKDFRPYAVGNNLKWKTMDGVDGKFESILTYKSKYGNKTIEYKSPSKEYSNSRIWENNSWIFKSMKQKVLIAPVTASITEQFDPFIMLKDLGPEERQLDYINDVLLQAKKHVYKLRDLKSMQIFSVEEAEFNKMDFPDSLFAIESETYLDDEDLDQISIRKLLFEGRKVFLLVARSVENMELNHIDRIKSIYAACKKKSVPFVMITSSSRKEIEVFRNKNNFHVPCFMNDETELKVISRINPCLLILQKGVVSEKYPNRSIPKIETIKKNYL